MEFSLTTLLIAALSFTLIWFFVYGVVYSYTRRYINRNKVLYFVGMGIFLGAISIFVYLIFGYLLNMSFNLVFLWVSLLSFIMYWISLNFVSFYSAIIVFLFNALATGLFPFITDKGYSAFDNFYIAIITFSYCLATIFWCINKYFYFFSIWLQWVMFTLILLNIALFFSIYYKGEINYLKNIYVLLISLSISICVIFGADIFERTYIHAKKLQNISKYDHLNFLKNNVFQEILVKKNSANKVRYGYFITYTISNFNRIEKRVGNEIINMILDYIASESYKIFKSEYKKATFFKTNYYTFGVFIPIDNFEDISYQASLHGNDLRERNQTDKIMHIENLLRKINTKFSFNEYLLYLNLVGAVSIYGINSNSISKLNSLNLSFIQNEMFPLLKYSKLFVINSQEMLNVKNENRKIAIMRDVSGVVFSSPMFKPIYDCTTNDLLGFKLGLMIKGDYVEFNSKSEIFAKLQEFNLKTIFIRYLGHLYSDVLKDNKKIIKDKKIFFPYDATYLSSTKFEIDEFIQKLNKYNVSDMNLIFTLSLNDELEDIKTLSNNIDALKQKGYQICLTDFIGSDIELSLLETYKPNYVIINSDIIKTRNFQNIHKDLLENLIKIFNKLDISLIAPSVDSYLTFRILTRMGFKCIYGNLLGDSAQPKVKIDKDIIYMLSKPLENKSKLFKSN